MAIWNPWHGCKKCSPGCENCYVYRRDAQFGKDSSIVEKTASFDLPIRRTRQGDYKLQPDGEPVYTCMTSDFLVPDADAWRGEIWEMIRERSDLEFIIITKRIQRFWDCIPSDWGEGYPNVSITCTCENQEKADERLPLFIKMPIRHKRITHEPMLGEIHIEPYLASGQIESVICGGESGEQARLCDYNWILSIREQCMRYQVNFHFKQTGALFRKDGRVYHVARKNQISQAYKAHIDYSASSMQNGGTADRAEWEELFQRLATSSFRSSFSLKEADKQYVQEKGMETIRRHAQDFIRDRLAPAEIKNDGKQTPMKGHPVFIAQHATATCCRGCLKKWHHIEPGITLTEAQQNDIVEMIMEWIRRQLI